MGTTVLQARYGRTSARTRMNHRKQTNGCASSGEHPIRLAMLALPAVVPPLQGHSVRGTCNATTLLKQREAGKKEQLLDCWLIDG